MKHKNNYGCSILLYATNIMSCFGIVAAQQTTISALLAGFTG